MKLLTWGQTVADAATAFGRAQRLGADDAAVARVTARSRDLDESLVLVGSAGPQLRTRIPALDDADDVMLQIVAAGEAKAVAVRQMRDLTFAADNLLHDASGPRADALRGAVADFGTELNRRIRGDDGLDSHLQFAWGEFMERMRAHVPIS